MQIKSDWKDDLGVKVKGMDKARQWSEVVKLIKRNGSYITPDILKIKYPKIAKRYKIDSNTLNEMLENEKLDSLPDDIYCLFGYEGIPNPDYFLLSIWEPGATLCLESALEYHNMTTKKPKQFDVVDFNGKKNSNKDKNINYIEYENKDKLSAGIEEIKGYANLKTFSRELALADIYSDGNDYFIAEEAMVQYKRLNKSVRNQHELKTKVMHFGKLILPEKNLKQLELAFNG